MDGRLESLIYRRAALPVFALLLFGITSFATPGSIAAEASESSPTVGEIIIDGYDCENGFIDFHILVTDLPARAEGASNGYPLEFLTIVFYEVNGESKADVGAVGVFGPAPQIAPYTGEVYLTADFPAVSGITVITVQVVVGNPAIQPQPTDATALRHPVDCNSGNTGESALVDQLITELVHILDDILNGQG